MGLPTRDEVAERLRAVSPIAGPFLVDGLLAAVRYATRPAPDSESPVGSSKIGGHPDLAIGVEWPGWSGHDRKTPRPLRFFAQLNLEQARSAALGDLNLPSSGLLSFFADFTDDGLTGISGLYGDEQDGCRVLYSAPGAPLERRRSPVPTLASAAFYPLGAWTWPQDVELLDAEFDALEDWNTDYENLLRQQCPPGWDLGGRHQLGGHARYIQHPVEEEVVQAVSGCYKRGGTFDARRWLEVQDQVKDWRVVVQIDSDQTLELMWGDVGTLYWAVPHADASLGDWSRAMFNFQCS
jgi:uncharacterized protein YwqG